MKLLRKSFSLARGHAPVVLAGMLAYAIVLCWACHAKFAGFGYDDFDLAHHAQSARNILRGSLDCSMLGIPFPGNHMALILFLIAPLCAVFPPPLLLLYLQSLTLASGAWPVFLLGKRVIGERWSAAFAFLYLVYPPLVFLNLYEFHPVAFAVPFMLWMFYFYEARRFKSFVLFMALAMSCQENIALVPIGFSACALLERRRGAWLYVPFLAGTVYFMLAVMVIMPHFNRNTIQFMRLYGHLGSTLPGVLATALRRPIPTLRFMLAPERLSFLGALLGPLAFVSLLSPVSLLPVGLVALQRLLSMRASEATIAYHYQAEFVPFVFAAAMFGARRILDSRRRIAPLILQCALVLLPLSAIVATGFVRDLHDAIALPRRARRTIETKNSIVRSLPKDAAILATFDFLPRLAGFEKVHSLHHVYTGCYTLSDVPYPTPELDYVVMDSNDPLAFSHGGFYGPENYKRLQTLLDGPGWEIAEHVNSVIVFRRVHGANAPATPLAHPAELPPGVNRNVSMPGSPDIDLLGFTAAPAKNARLLCLTLFWSKKTESRTDYNMKLVVAGTGVLFEGVLAPGSRIWPPQSWPAGSVIADRHCLAVAGDRSGGEGASQDAPATQALRLHVELVPL